MTTPLLLPQRIPSSQRTVLLRNLRPGDWLRGPTGIMFCVYRHHAKTQRVQLWSTASREGFVFAYEEMLAMNYVGRGKPRYWLTKLPAWLIGKTCLYSRP